MWNPKQKAAIIEALRNKSNPTMQPMKQVPLGGTPIIPHSPPSMSAGIGAPETPHLNANPASIAPPNPMGFLKIRKALKPKV